MRLYDLPPELISQVLNGERSNAAITLWLTGNRLIAAKLANKGIVDVELKCESDQYPTVWPQCLSSFKLHSLVIECLERSNLSLDQLRSGISQLPNTLLRLEVHHHGAYEAIFGDTIIVGFYDLVVNFTAFDRSHPGETPFTKIQVDTRCDLSSTLDKLEHLKLVDASNETRHLTGRAASLLPASLTSLGVDKLDLHESANYAVQLPNLKSLAIQHLPAPEALELLPRSLTALRAEQYLLDSLKRLANEYESIAPKLVDLYYSATSAPRASKRDDGTWPPYIKTLVSFGEETESFPQSLTYLSSNHFIQAWDSASRNILPDTITDLELSDIPWSSLTSNSWPRSLTSLTFDYDPDFNQMHFHRLPRTLVKLMSIGSELDHPPSKFDHDAATALGKLMLDGPEKQSWNTDKQELILLGSRNGRRLMSKIEAYIDAVERGELFGLPLSLNRVFFSSMIVYPNSRLLLPPKLNALITKPFSGLALSEFWDLLPPSVTFMSMYSSCDGDDIDMPHISGPSDFGLFHRNSFDRVLLDVSLAKISDSLISVLPRSLQVLSVTTTTEALKDLPPNLIDLDFTCIGEDASTTWISTLPRSLKRLEVSGKLISGYELQQLPHNLEILKCGLTSMTLDQLLAMPCQSLRVLEGITSDTHRFDSRLLLPDEISELIYRFRPFWRLLRASRADLDAILTKIRDERDDD